MARSLFSIKGILFTSTSNTEKTHGEINDEIRSIAGVVTLNTRNAGGDKVAVVVKVDPYPYGGKFTQEVHDKVVSEIQEVPGVRKFKVQESPFIKPEPKQQFSPVPQAPKSYDQTSTNNPNPR